MVVVYMHTELTIPNIHSFRSGHKIKAPAPAPAKKTKENKISAASINIEGKMCRCTIPPIQKTVG